MQIHGMFEQFTCDRYLPKKKRAMIGYVAACEQCDSQYVLRPYYSRLVWVELKKGKK